MIHPFRIRRFWQISLDSAAAVRASKRSSIIANKKSKMRFPSSHRWTLFVTRQSPKKWLSLKTRIFTFGVAFHFFVEGNCSFVLCGQGSSPLWTPALRSFNGPVRLPKLLWVKHSKSHPTHDKPSLKWAWSRHVTHFKFLVPLRYLWNGLSYRLCYVQADRRELNRDLSVASPTHYRCATMQLV